MNIQTIKNLNKLKNASLIKSESISLEYSFLILNIIQNLYKEGFIQSFKVKKDLKTEKKFIIVNLRYYFNFTSGFYNDSSATTQKWFSLNTITTIDNSTWS